MLSRVADDEHAHDESFARRAGRKPFAVAIGMLSGDGTSELER